MRLNSQPPTQCNLKPSHHYSQMSFFDKFKRAMGFPSMDEEEIEEGIDATVTPLRERQQRAGEPEVAPEVAPTPVSPGPDCCRGSGGTCRSHAPSTARSDIFACGGDFQ